MSMSTTGDSSVLTGRSLPWMARTEPPVARCGTAGGRPRPAGAALMGTRDPGVA
jgi:hypothetical protein